MIDYSVVEEKAVSVIDDIKAATYEYLCDLDADMLFLNGFFRNTDNLTPENIKNYLVRLSVSLYKAENGLRDLSIKETLSKIEYRNTYNEAFMNPSMDKAKPTVAELTAYAEEVAAEKKLVNEVYSTAYDTVKNKVDGARTMISSLTETLKYVTLVNNNRCNCKNECEDGCHRQRLVE